LKNLHERREFAATTGWINNPSAKMPKMFPGILNAQDVNHAASFLNEGL
jgi:hypothetical protein